MGSYATVSRLHPSIVFGKQFGFNREKKGGKEVTAQGAVNGVHFRTDVAQAFRMGAVSVRIKENVAKINGSSFGYASGKLRTSHWFHANRLYVPCGGVAGTVFQGNANIVGGRKVGFVLPMPELNLCLHTVSGFHERGGHEIAP
jgi:hypothetical protein